MARLRSILCSSALMLLASLPAVAQDPVAYTLKLAAGPAGGGLLSPLGRAGYTFGADFEVSYERSQGSQFVLGLGWRAFPGDFVNVSFIPYTYAATGVNPTVYETRVRKPEGQGFQLTGLYRGAVKRWEGAYWQGGLRIGANKLSETDTGTQLVTDGRASTVSGNVLAVNTIVSVREKKTLSVGPMLGVGYEFNGYTLEVNAWAASMESPTLGKKSGVATELAFGFRF